MTPVSLSKSIRLIHTEIPFIFRIFQSDLFESFPLNLERKNVVYGLWMMGIKVSSSSSSSWLGM